EIVRAVGRLAKDASRVEVPFASVTAAPNEWWSRDSREGVEVALGRAGATKLQPMRLGSGTSQHVLIAGKTGSGKSTLLNALIVNLAIWYSPEELQFYLIDFKKGVEFKPYAAYSLPHARVIAVESEREFGMSVLERLDAELRERGDLFRKQGVQNLAAWRDANPDEVMPRLLLIIDEFQEFFVKDDKIGSDAALLLDRLVRQGRAFGIHVLLGSQTLAGAYTLARSTLGQMAVRIALQCSESDAHLILSDDNTAARLLSRPGEAIYNDANGLFEGNHPFQVVWLSDNEREHYLERIGELAKIRAPRVEPPIVFEGNQPADPSENRHLAALLETRECGRPTVGAPEGDGDVELNAAVKRAAAKVWLGAAVAIKEPTSITFHRQGGANVLVVGPQEELAVGLLANCVLSLALDAVGGKSSSSIDDADSHGEAGSNGSSGAAVESAMEPLVTVLDGLRPESALAGSWNRFKSRMPNLVQVVSGRNALDAVAELANEVSRRTDAHDEQGPARFLVIANLARFRELQRGDDFGFSSFGEEEKPDPGKQFRTILREGPAVGVHTLIWADSFSSASRWLDRQTLQDLDYRVLFQMGAGDSSNLMDSSAAANLGPYRAILYRHELGEFEKFRPYAYPTHAWIGRIADVVNSEISGGASSFAAEAAVVRPSLESVD
ncbi:MAG: AAA family ATPase, partial [Planctomycetales bacterium]|nr:AAA family ATPase [Planctomycetales bacterium]